MHLAIPGTEDVDEALVAATAARLLSVPRRGVLHRHCTGLPSYALLRRLMGERVQYLRAGESVCL